MNAILPVMMQRGVDLLRDKRRIADESLALAKNFLPTELGFGASRLGTKFDSMQIAFPRLPIKLAFPTFESAVSRVIVTRNFLPIAPPSGFTFLGGAQNTEIWAINDGYGAADSFDMGVRTAERPSIASLIDKIYAFAGPAATPCVIAPSGSTPGFTMAAFTFNGSGNTIMPFIAVPYRQRMIFLNFGGTYGSYAVMSDDFDPATIGNNGLTTRGFLIGANDGDRITGGVALSQTGSEAQSICLIFKEYSAYILSGEMVNTTDDPSVVFPETIFGDMEIMRIPINCGCASMDTIVQTPYGCIWAGPDDVWIFHVGQQPISLGEKIAKRFKNTPAVYRRLWHAEYHDGFYRLAIMAPDQVQNADTKMAEQWWLDLRNGVPRNSEEAVWWGPMEYNIATRKDTVPVPGTRFMAVDRRPEQDQKLFAVEDCQRYPTGPVQIVVNLLELEDDSAYDNGLDDTGLVPFPRHNQIDNEVEFEVDSKDYSYKDALVDKLINGHELSVYSDIPSRIGIDNQLDGGRQLRTYEASIPVLTSVAEPGDKVLQALAVTPEPTVRDVGKYLQFRLYNKPGYVVDTSNNQIQFRLKETIAYASYLAEIEIGFYDNLFLLCEEIASKIEEALGAGFTVTHNMVRDPPRPEFVTFSIAGTYIDWFFATATQLVYGPATTERCANLLGALGYSTLISPTAGNPDQAAIVAVPFRRAAKTELGDWNVSIRPDRRRPL